MSAHTSTRRFDPPDGLLPHEEVIWVSTKIAILRGIPFLERLEKEGWALPVFLLLFGGVFFGLGVGAPLLTGSCNIRDTPRPPVECAWYGAIFGPMFVIGLVLLRRNIANYHTRYYLTNFRLVETRKGRIVRELFREVFRGLPLSRYLEKVATEVLSDDGTQYFSVRILNPQSGAVIMALTLPEASVSALEWMTKLVYCRYCGRKNEVESTVCTYCGANL